MAPFNSYIYLNNDPNGLHEEDMDHAADIFPTIEESSFCSNFQCCGRSLKDLHELLHHYEESHVRIEDGDEDVASASGMFDFDTVLAADSLLNVGADASSRSNAFRNETGNFKGASGLSIPTPSVSPQNHPSKRPRILTLGIETCDYADDDSEHLSAFDNTVIRPVDAYKIQNHFNGQYGYARIAPKRSHSVPALPNFPLINGENGFKLIHSILSSTADPPSSEHLSYPSGSVSSQNGISNGISSVSSGYSGSTYSLSRSGNDRPFVCPVNGCGKTYKNANGLKYHAIHGHDGVLVEKPHKCPYNGCGKRYKNSNGLKYHFQHAHPNSPPPSGLALTPSSGNYSSYSSSGNYYNRPISSGYNNPGSYTSAVSAGASYAPSVQVTSSIQPPPRPHSTLNPVPAPPMYNRPVVAPIAAYSPAPPTPSVPASSNVPSLSPETVQNLLSNAPAAIANLLKKNPNLKQHLPTILRNLQQIALQKSNNTSQQTDSANQEKKISQNNPDVTGNFK